MKICPICGNEKNINDFTRDITRPDGKYWCCRLCKRARARVYSPKYLDDRRERGKKRTERTNEFLNEIKAAGCEFCPEKENVCLDFHHRNPTDKDFQISNYKNSKFEKIKEEVAKCVVVCSNCHRKIHAGLIKLGD